MNDDFLGTLPWRLGSLAGLIVGIVSFAEAGVDVWTGLERIGIAFAAFFILGVVAQRLIVMSSYSSDRVVRKSAAPQESSDKGKPAP